MAQPVWVLSVDLQTKTATFTSGMADAAKAARGSFDEIKSSASTMGRETSGSMSEARHGVMLLGEEFGVHLPRGITTFLSSLGPVAAAMEAAFPFLAIIVGATLLLEHLAKLKEANVKIGAEWGSVEVEATKALNKMGDALLQVEMESDRLAGNSLAALHKQLLLIDHQTMSELESTFDALASKIDATLKAASRGSLMTTLLGEGASDKVKAEFDKFKAQYDALLSQRNDSGARGALVDEIIHAQEQLKKYQAMPQTNSWVREAVSDYTQLNAQLQNMNQLQDESSELDAKKKGNVVKEDDNKTAEAQQRGLDEYVRRREEAERKISELRKKAAQEEVRAAEDKIHADDAFMKALREEASERAKLAAEAGKEDAGHGLKMGELQLAGEREQAKLRMSVTRTSAQEQMNMELQFANQENQLKMQASAQEIAALDKNGKDYENKLKALQNKQLEMTREYENQKAQITGQAEAKKLASVIAAEDRMGEAIARNAASSIAHGQSMARAFAQLGDSMLQTALQNLMMMETVQGRKRFGDARTAAADAFASAGNPILGAVEAALAFTSVMAFEKGGIVPGVELGDVVNARLTPGETVIPKQMTERLNKASDSGSSGGDTHFHSHSTFHVHAIDGASVRGMLDKHKEDFSRHFHNEVRKMNR